MSKKTEHYGQESGGRSSDKWLSPSNPQTGDGNTTRTTADPVTNVNRDANGNKI
jgi:hypothetical protein